MTREWRARRDSNSRPLGPQPNALSTELRAPCCRSGPGEVLAEREGFEPSKQVTPLGGLANRCTRPLCDLSVADGGRHPTTGSSEAQRLLRRVRWGVGAGAARARRGRGAGGCGAGSARSRRRDCESRDPDDPRVVLRNGDVFGLFRAPPPNERRGVVTGSHGIRMIPAWCSATATSSGCFGHHPRTSVAES